MTSSPRSPQTLLDALPHRAPFRFVDELRSVSGDSATGAWIVRGDESFFAGHFPGRPIVPGVLIAEALAQTSGFIIGRRSDEAHRHSPSNGALAMLDVKFLAPVVPPATIELKSELERDQEPLYLFAVSAHVDGRCVARGRLALSIAPAASERA